MKKILYLLLVTFFFGLVMTSCHPCKQCPAYNNYRYYQREKAF